MNNLEIDNIIQKENNLKNIDKYNVVNNLNNICLDKESAVTIGNFDGLHLGHLELIKETVSYAKENNLNSIVFTFCNHPANFLKENSIKYILTNKEKIEIIKSMGVDIIINIKFDEYMTKIDKFDFVEEILLKILKAKKIIVGHDFTFAKNKEGNVETLKDLSKKLNFNLQVVDEIKLNCENLDKDFNELICELNKSEQINNVELLDKNLKDIRISSTYIRNLIENGEVNKVKYFLGRNYSLSGIVIHARKLGRTIGFPTANIDYNKEILIPKNGIYATKVYIQHNSKEENKEYFGATNIGFNPTVNGKKLSIETNILNFDEDIYGKNIRIEFLERIRDEKKFNSLDELKNQLQKDVNFVRQKYLK